VTSSQKKMCEHATTASYVLYPLQLASLYPNFELTKADNDIHLHFTYSASLEILLTQDQWDHLMNTFPFHKVVCCTIADWTSAKAIEFVTKLAPYLNNTSGLSYPLRRLITKPFPPTQLVNLLETEYMHPDRRASIRNGELFTWADNYSSLRERQILNWVPDLEKLTLRRTSSQQLPSRNRIWIPLRHDKLTTLTIRWLNTPDDIRNYVSELNFPMLTEIKLHTSVPIRTVDAVSLLTSFVHLKRIEIGNVGNQSYNELLKNAVAHIRILYAFAGAYKHKEQCLLTKLLPKDVLLRRLYDILL